MKCHVESIYSIILVSPAFLPEHFAADDHFFVLVWQTVLTELSLVYKQFYITITSLVQMCILRQLLIGADLLLLKCKNEKRLLVSFPGDPFHMSWGISQNL